MFILIAILLFSFLIFIHELGHFLAAKFSGVQVNEFSLFMGPAIFKKQVGETLYSVRCIPFGGYCAMEGEDSDSESSRSFRAASWWKRLIILVAGAAMNFIVGLLILVILMIPQQYAVIPEIVELEETSTLAGEAGLRVGDILLEMDGEKIFTNGDFEMILSAKGGTTHDLVVDRQGQRITLEDVEVRKQAFPDGQGGTSMRYGFSFGVEELTFGSRLRHAWLMALDYVRMARLSLGMLLSGQVGVSNISGPVGIVQQMSSVAAQSETAYYATLNMLNFAAMIAINLAVMNLLPIPALDGGRTVGLLLTTAAEAIMGRKIDPKYEAYLHGIGMILLLALMALVMFKDIFVIIKG